MKIGDRVEIIKHKYPELHPPLPIKKSIKGADGKNYYYTLRGLNYIGLTGVIDEIFPRTEQNIQVVLDPSWRKGFKLPNKHVWMWEEELKVI